MRPSRRILAKALTFIVLAGVLGSGTALAQFYDPVVRSLGLTNDVARSPRLVGMGGLSLVVPDRYNGIDLWNFAGSALGAYRADTSSTFDLRPGSSSAEGAYNPSPGSMREVLAGRVSSAPLDVFYRDKEGNAIGAVGSLGSAVSDHPFGDNIELRRSVSQPVIVPIMTGPFPYYGKGKLLYAVRLKFARENLTDQYRRFVENGAGAFMSLGGKAVTPPDYFTPTDYEVRTFSIGGALAYPLGKSTTLALGVDRRTERINGTDDLSRSLSQTSEHRPTTTGQATLIGHLGKSLEYGVDGTLWTSRSEERWMFTISSGSGVAPLAGRGLLLKREGEGSTLNSRARWTSGALELGGQVWTRWSRVKIVTPLITDRTSFNYFLSSIYYRTGADSLALPDSVVANQYNDHAMGFGGGASWKLSKGVIGVEYHQSRDAIDQEYAGAGPKPLAWDIRSGFEYECSRVITGRVGAGMGWNDEDDYTKGNEWTTRFVTLGLGVHPTGATWAFDLGYALAWSQADFGDPTDHRYSRQQLQSLVHWSF